MSIKLRKKRVNKCDPTLFFNFLHQASPRVMPFFRSLSINNDPFPNSCGKRGLRRRFPSLVMKNFIPNLCVKA